MIAASCCLNAEKETMNSKQQRKRTPLLVNDYNVFNHKITIRPKRPAEDPLHFELPSVVCYFRSPSSQAGETQPLSLLGCGSFFVTSQKGLCWMRIQSPGYPIDTPLFGDHGDGAGFLIKRDSIVTLSVASFSGTVQGLGSSPFCLKCVIDEHSIEPAAFSVLYFIPLKGEGIPQSICPHSSLFPPPSIVQRMYGAFKDKDSQGDEEIEVEMEGSDHHFVGGINGSRHGWKKSFNSFGNNNNLNN